MKKIIAVNCSPRPQWNTAKLVRKAAEGACIPAADLGVISGDLLHLS